MYKHGIYGERIPSEEPIPPAGVGTLPIYVGTAPVHTLADYSEAIDNPLLVNSFTQAKEIFGYDDDWDKYTLCEAMYAHFKNSVQPIGPIILINVYDPDRHTSIDDVTEDDIIGKYDTITDKKTGIESIDWIYQTYNMVPNLLQAPKWSSKKAVYEALCDKCEKINTHWDATCNTDIDSNEVRTISDAIAAKESYSYNNVVSKVCYPMVKYDGKLFHLSTMTAVRMQQTDFRNENIPNESPSNEQISCVGTFLADGSQLKFDNAQANRLNEVGITTASFMAGVWRLWGPHMANYEFPATGIKYEEMSDSAVRMQRWLTNAFQSKFHESTDKSLSKRRAEQIVDDAKYWLNSLVKDGKLLYAAIEFVRKNNPNNAIAEGDFVFDVKHTGTPNIKSLTFRVQHTSLGYSSLFEEDGE